MKTYKDIPIIGTVKSQYTGPIVTEDKVKEAGWMAWRDEGGKYYYNFGYGSHGGITHTVEVTREEFEYMRDKIEEINSISASFYCGRRGKSLPCPEED